MKVLSAFFKSKTKDEVDSKRVIMKNGTLNLTWFEWTELNTEISKLHPMQSLIIGLD